MNMTFRVVGTLVGVGLGAITALLEAVLTPLYIGSFRSPLAALLALVGNVAIVWFTYVVTRNVGLALLPGAAWLIVMYLAITPRSEGDLIVTGTWVGGLTFLLGSLGWAGAGYYLITHRGKIGARGRSDQLMLGVPGEPSASSRKTPARTRSKTEPVRSAPRHPPT
jgi:hypothetical protein